MYESLVNSLGLQMRPNTVERELPAPWGTVLAPILFYAEFPFDSTISTSPHEMGNGSVIDFGESWEDLV